MSRHKGSKKEDLFALRQEVWERYVEGVYAELGEGPLMEVDGRPTVGMQRALYGFVNSVFWAHFFDHLGLRLVLTPSTDVRISRAGIETIVAETCYPVKVSHGHVKELMGRTRYLFLPSLIDMPTTTSSERGFFCPLVQGNSYMVRMALDLDPSTLLNPVLHLKYDPDTLAVEMAGQFRDRLKVGRGEIRKAIYYAMERQDRFTEELYRRGREFLASHPSDEPFVVVTGRPYNLYDERVNLRLGQNLAKIGVSAIPMDFIDASSVDLSDFPSMYWGLGGRILRTAKLIREQTNAFGLHMTNFACGADSFIEHFYRHVMGDKAYLILELDEHSAVAGVMTRLEAYKNVIDHAVLKSNAAKEIGLRQAS